VRETKLHCLFLQNQAYIADAFRRPTVQSCQKIKHEKMT